MEKCLQETYAPHSTCFGCGPSNSKGLRIRSFPRKTEVVAEWSCEPHHEAFPGVLNGGIVGALLDCHSNWATAWLLMQNGKLERPPCTVTAEYAIKLLAPTPTTGKLWLTASPTEIKANKATMEAKLMAGDLLCATCRGTFVAVKPGHPAYHRW